MISITFKDGSEYVAETWPDLLRELNEDPWNSRMNETELREQLVHRAMVWGAAALDPALPPRDLFKALERSGMLRITRDV